GRGGLIRSVSPVAGVTSHPPRRFRASLFQRSLPLVERTLAATINQARTA
ncbi:hypothetical protein ACUW9A_002902, partial [Sphingomonas sanguinis]